MADTEISTTVITSEPRSIPDLGEAWRYRKLALAFARRNIMIRYKQTILGSLWIGLQPLFLAGILTVVLGLFLQVPSDGMPYAIFALSGTTIWNAFQRALNEASMSLASTGSIVQKVYFPRILVPASAVIAAIADFLPVYAVLVIAVVATGRFPGWIILASPLFVILALLMAFSIGLCMTALDAALRDIRLVIPALLQVVMYLSPITYPTSSVPGRWRILYEVNPMVGIVEGFRWSMVAGAAYPSPTALAWSIAFMALTAAIGMILFTRLESFAIDRI
jgi:lipopolysaccharide transport system permease protein